MAKFDLEQVMAVASIKQLIAEWVHEIDTHAGLSITQADVLTKTCRSKLLGQWIEGREAIARFYQGLQTGSNSDDERTVIRQLVSNFRVSFVSEAEANVAFQLLLFARKGKVPFSDYCEPVEVADVRMDCQREADGHWRISMLDSDRIFRRD